jgi:DHA2 family multidrug resistance protein
VSGAGPVERRPVNRGLITLFVMMAVLMQSLDSTIANVALPYMQGSMSASQDQIEWVLTSYIVAAAVMTTPAGWLAARFGRTRVFVTAVIGFTIASVFCGLSQSIGEIVAARLLQGMFGASLVPLAQSVMIDSYPVEQRGRAMAMFGIGVMVGPILGPTLGGWLTSHYTWRWVFYVNVPIGTLATFGLLTFLPETDHKPSRFDWTGFLLLSLGVGAFQAMLDRGSELDWFGSREIVLEACAAGVGFYCFIVHFVLAERPFISPRLLRDRNFVVGSCSMFFIGMIMYSSLALLSPYLQTLLGYPVLTTGFAMAPSGVGTMVAMFLTGRLLGVFSARMLILAGFAMLVGALSVMTRFSPAVSELHIAATTFVQGASMGVVFVALSTVTFTTLPMELRAQGTSLYSLMRNMGSAIGISVTGTLLQRNLQVNHETIEALVNPFNRLLQYGAAGRFWNPAHPAGAAALDGMITQQAMTISYSDDFKLLMVVAILATPLAFLISTPRAVPGAAAEAMVMD